MMTDITPPTSLINLNHPKNCSPSLKRRLFSSILVIVLPLFLLACIGFFFFQKTTNAFNHTIEEIVSNIIPVTELKDQIQQSVTPFNHYLKTHQLDDKNQFLTLSENIKKALIQPLQSTQNKQSLTNDIYRSAYLNWRIAHRIAIKIFAQQAHPKTHISHQLLQNFYQHVIETTLALDKLHLAMQARVKVRYQKAKALKFDALLLISVGFLLVYLTSLGTIIYLNHSIMKPIQTLGKWAHQFSQGESVEPLKLHSYQELEFIAETFNQLSHSLFDTQTLLTQLAQTDELTTLNNRRSFIRQLKNEHNRHQRYNTRYSLMLIDVDHLSAINQNYNKTVCDLTLIYISKILKEAIRPTDFLARYGSDEFIILLPEVEAHGTNKTAERIRNSISEYVFKIEKFKFGVTVSIGFSLIQEEQSLIELLNCVDYALQQAKLAGRNQVQYGENNHLQKSQFKEKYLKEADVMIN
jgi:diguanylate cyclase (GGDEF)-like protein